MLSDSKTLTTGKVAKLLQVAARTVVKWFDSGRIKGYRLPGSLDRRITVGAVREFVLANGIPMPAELEIDSAATTTG